MTEPLDRAEHSFQAIERSESGSIDWKGFLMQRAQDQSNHPDPAELAARQPPVWH